MQRSKIWKGTRVVLLQLGVTGETASHASTGTAQLYDRREDRVTLDEVVKINFGGEY